MFTLSNFSEDDNYIDLMVSLFPVSVISHEVILYMILTFDNAHFSKRNASRIESYIPTYTDQTQYYNRTKRLSE